MRDFIVSPYSLYDLILSAPSAIIGANGLGEIIYATSAIKNVLGWSQDELRGKRITLLIPDRLKPMHRQGFERFSETGVLTHRGRPMRTMALHKEGHEVPVELTIGSFRTEETNDLRVVAMIRNIQDYIELEEESIRLQRQLTFMRDIAMNLGEGLIASNSEGNVTLVNPAAEKMLGYTESDLLGKNAHDCLHSINPDGSEEDRTTCPILQTMKDGRSRHIDDDYFRRSNGSFINVSIIAAPLYRENVVVGNIVTFFDISVIKRHIEYRDRLASIVQWSESAIFSKDLKGVITSWNPAAEKLYGWTADEAIGQHISLIVPLERRGEVQTILHDIAQGKTIKPYETFRKRKDGSIISILLTVSPIKDDQGNVLGASIITHKVVENENTTRPDQ